MNTKQRMLILAPVLLIAAYLALFGDKTPNNGVAEPVTTRGVSKAIEPDITSSSPVSAEAEPTNPSTIMRLASREPLKGELGRPDVTDVFSVSGGPPPPVKPVEKVAPPPPPPPQITFVYVGKKYEDGKWTAFFEKDSRILIAQEGTTIEGFRVDEIRPDDIQLTDWQTKGIHIIPTKGGR